MKTKISLLFGLLLAFSAPAQIVYLNLGTSANDGTGDKLRTGGISINTNFYWLSNLTATASNAARTLSYSIGTDSTNFTLAASNSVRLVAGLAATNQANANSVAASNLSYSIGTDATNFTLTASNSVRLVAGLASTNLANANSVAASNLSYSIGTASTNFSLTASNSVRLVAGLAATNADIGILQSATNFTLTTVNSASNLIAAVATLLIPTNSALSNLTVNFLSTNTLEIYATNNLTFTNWIGQGANLTFNKTIFIRPQLITRGVNWGNLGLSNPGYGVAIATNANNLLWTSLTNGKTYALTITPVGTNLFPALILWE